MLLAAASIARSVLGANAVARNSAETSQQSFKSSSNEIDSALQVAIRQEEDLGGGHEWLPRC